MFCCHGTRNWLDDRLSEVQTPHWPLSFCQKLFGVSQFTSKSSFENHFIVLVGFIICLFRSSHRSLKRLNEGSNQYGQMKNIHYTQGKSEVISMKPGTSAVLEPFLEPSSPGEFDRLNPMARNEYPSSPIKQSIPHCRFDSRFESRFERPEVRIQTNDHISDEETPILSLSPK